MRKIFKSSIVTVMLLFVLIGCINNDIPSDENIVNNYGELPISAIVREGRRPIPVSGISGKGYDDLLFYDRSSALETRTPEEIFQSLSEGRVIADNDRLMAASVTGPEYGSAGKITVSDMPFTEAWQVTVTGRPENSWDYQLELPGLIRGTDFRHGETLLLVLSMRTISTAMEDGNGKIQCTMEWPVAPYAVAFMEEVFTPAGEGWFTVYLPVSADGGHTRLCIRLGLGVQTVQFGGYQIINYETKYLLNQLPNSGMKNYSEGLTVFDRDFQWRRDAWTRIKQIRKGDINVIVKDSSGRAVKRAQVKAEMYEHEFKWGTAVNTNIIDNDRYRAAVSMLFNTVTLEGYHQWRYWQNNPAPARDFYNALKAPGINNMRGHALIWDRTGSLPADVANWYQSDVANNNTANKGSIDNAIRTHFSTIAGEYRDQVYVWDVVNEIMNNADMQNYYGRGILKDWFAWARQGAGTDCLLFINETGIVGPGKSLDNFKAMLNYMRDINVDFDGIGIQGHCGNASINPENFYNMLEQLNEYNKVIEITEFDMGLLLSESDREYESSFTRDIMIAAFSQVNTIGFTMWGFWSGAHWRSHAPVFNVDWSLKESGKQYIDLVYNKWLTNESGRTGADGTCRFRGFYGDYDITVSAGGKTKTVEARFYKGGDNTVTVVLE